MNKGELHKNEQKKEGQAIVNQKKDGQLKNEAGCIFSSIVLDEENVISSSNERDMGKIIFNENGSFDVILF